MTPRVTFWATAAALAVFNVARALGAFGRFGDAVGLVVALVIVAVALRTGLDRRAMGLTGDRVRSGLAWGGGAFGLVLAVVVGAALLPASSGFLDDDRARLGFGSLVFELVVSILLLTVIPEELTFRGVLLGAGSETWGPRKGAVASSAVFGLWHIAPTLNTAGGNAQLSDAGSTVRRHRRGRARRRAGHLRGRDDLLLAAPAVGQRPRADAGPPGHQRRHARGRLVRPPLTGTATMSDSGTWRRSDRRTRR